MKWLVSAFAPFGGAKENASFTVLKQMQTLDWQDQVKLYGPVPVEFGSGWDHLRKIIEVEPDLDGVLALGVSEGRQLISLERVALNWIDARIPDNRGITPPKGRIIENGPDVLWSPIPWDNFDSGLVSQRSYSAGTYVCNELMYRSLDWAEARGKMAGFVHVPNSTPEVVRELRRVLEFLVRL